MPKSKTPKAEPLPAYSTAAAQAWMDITTQCASFAMDRVQQDFAAQRAMMTCASPADLMQMQVRYCQEAAKQYTDHAARMINLMTAAIGQGSGDGTGPFSRKYDDIPL